MLHENAHEGVNLIGVGAALTPLDLVFSSAEYDTDAGPPRVDLNLAKVGICEVPMDISLVPAEENRPGGHVKRHPDGRSRQATELPVQDDRILSRTGRWHRCRFQTDDRLAFTTTTRLLRTIRSPPRLRLHAGRLRVDVSPHRPVPPLGLVRTEEDIGQRVKLNAQSAQWLRILSCAVGGWLRAKAIRLRRSLVHVHLAFCRALAASSFASIPLVTPWTQSVQGVLGEMCCR
jgi:hypothetical protein